MKVFVTGAQGQLGYDVVNELINRGYDVIASDIKSHNSSYNCDYVQLDICNKKDVEFIIDKHRPDAVIHCAAWTNVDEAEKPENIKKVRDINVNGTKNIANACDNINCKMLYISTDYVFNGRNYTSIEPEYERCGSLNIYGTSKLSGERIVDKLEKYFIVRISWAFGVNGSNFVKTMLNLGKTNKDIQVVYDQIGSPTYTYDLAKLLADMINTDKYGYYHATNEGYISWYEFAKAIFKQAVELGHTEYEDVTVIPINTADYKSLARRPLCNKLDKSKLVEKGFNLLPPWEDALSRYLKEIEF